jgi:hypothetical protein
LQSQAWKFGLKIWSKSGQNLVKIWSKNLVKIWSKSGHPSPHISKTSCTFVRFFQADLGFLCEQMFDNKNLWISFAPVDNPVDNFCSFLSDRPESP